MFIVGITGGIGCGKTAVTNLLATHGVTIVDADIVAREVVEPGEPALNTIAEHFGRDIINESGELDRAALRVKVFRDATERKWLETLLHPIIRNRIIEQLNHSEGNYAVLSSPLLLETDQKSLTDHIVVIDLPEELQVSRTMQRDSNSAEQIKAIISAQMPREQKLQEADTIICNDAGLDSLRNKVEQLHLDLTELSQRTDEQTDH